MVTGEKPDEQAEWSEVVEFGDLVSAAIDQVFEPFRVALEAFSQSLLGIRAADIPEWMHELWRLEALHAEVGLRGRARRRLAQLRKVERRFWRLQARVLQRELLGIRDV